MTSLSVHGPIGDAALPGKDRDHRRQFGPCMLHGTPLLTSVTEYDIRQWAFIDAKRFRAILFLRTFRAQTPRGRAAAQ